MKKAGKFPAFFICGTRAEPPLGQTLAAALHQAIIKQMNQRLFAILEATDGTSMPLYPDKGGVQNLRHPDRSKSAPFPKSFEGPRNRERKPQ